MANEFMRQIEAEVVLARAKFPAGFHSAHEAYGVILEELDEFWDEVRQQRQDPSRLLRELIQTAAMCMRAAEDLGLIK